MGYRRFAQLATSDDDDASSPPRRAPPPTMMKTTSVVGGGRRRRSLEKWMKRRTREEEIERRETVGERGRGREQGEPAANENAKPVGDVIRVSGKGRGRRNHFVGFEYDGLSYDLAPYSDPRTTLRYANTGLQAHKIIS